MLDAIANLNKFTLVKVWKKIKDDAAKARKSGKKPGGGGQGFESDLDKLEKEIGSKNPDPVKAFALISSLKKKFADYGRTLPADETVLANGVKQMVNILEKMGVAVADVEKASEGQVAEYRALMMRMTKVNAILLEYGKEIDGLKAKLGELATDRKASVVLEIKTVATKLDELDKRVLKIAKEYADLQSGIRILYK